MNLQTSSDKKRITFIGLLFAIYYAVLACYNTPVTLRVGYITVAGLIIADKLFSKDRLKIEFPTACKYLYYFTVYCYFSRFWAWEEYLVVNSADFLVPVMIFLLVAVNYFIKIRSVKACIYAVIFSGLALGIYVIIDNGGISSFYSDATHVGNRLTAGSRNENFLGLICAMSIVCLLYYAIYKRKKICFLISVLPFVSLITSGSRTAMVTLAIGIAVLVLLSQNDKKGIIKYLKLIGTAIIVLICAKLVLSLEIMSTINERLQGTIKTLTGNSSVVDGSTTIRLDLIKTGWEQFKKTPFLGIGFGNSPLLNWRKMGHYFYCHNEYIEHLVNGGIISFVLYYGTILYLLVKHIKLIKIDKNPEIVLSLTTIIMYLAKGIGDIGYYGQMQTYLYFTLWISEVAICEREQHEKFLQESSKQNNQDGIS